MNTATFGYIRRFAEGPWGEPLNQYADWLVNGVPLHDLLDQRASSERVDRPADSSRLITPSLSVPSAAMLVAV
jgi:hypothetical protein